MMSFCRIVVLMNALVSPIAVFGDPNFVIILMDDQDSMLDSPNYMPNLQSMIVSQGITMNNGFVATPVCCPSRTQLITGRYYHNIGAPHGKCMHIDATSNVISNTSLFSIMNKNGYKTGVFGKLTNADANYFCEYEKSGDGNITKNISTIAGMSRVYSMCNQNDYYDIKYFNKFENNSYFYTNLSLNDPGTYQISQVGNASIEWIEEKLMKKEKFLSYIGSHAPHIPYVVPEWFENVLSKSVKAPRTVNFNVNITDQLPYIVNNPMLDNKSIDNIDQIYRDRIESTLQVDVIIDELIGLLNKYNEINNTYIIYLSDHGYHLGQWGVPCEKTLVYDTDIRIPFYIRGPNIKPNTSSDIIVGNVDIMPLIFDIANINWNSNNSDDCNSSIYIPTGIDGKSFKSYILNDDNKEDNTVEKQAKEGHVNSNGGWRSEFLVEYIIGPSLTGSWVTPDMYYNSCETWYAVNNDFHGSLIKPDPMMNGGDSVDDLLIIYGRDHDIQFSNTYRMLRIINDTHDWTYAEYVNYSFAQHDFENPLFYAFYDLKKDKYQLNNDYNQLDNQTKQELHQMLMEYGACQSTKCP